MKEVLLLAITVMVSSTRGLNFGPYYNSFFPGPALEAPHLPSPLEAFPGPFASLGYPGAPGPFGSQGLHGDAMMFGVPGPLGPPPLYGMYPMFGIHGRDHGPYGDMQPFGRFEPHIEHRPFPRKRNFAERMPRDKYEPGKGTVDIKVNDKHVAYESKADVSGPYQYDRYDPPVAKGRAAERYQYDEHMPYTRTSESSGGYLERMPREDNTAFDKSGSYAKHDSHVEKEPTNGPDYYDRQGLHDRQTYADRSSHYHYRDPTVDGPPHYPYRDQYSGAHMSSMIGGNEPFHRGDYYAGQGPFDGPAMSDRSSNYPVRDTYNNDHHVSTVGDHIGNGFHEYHPSY